MPGSAASRARQAANLVASLPAGVAASRYGGDFDASYVAMWKHFAECVRGGAKPLCTLMDGRAAVAVSHACLESVSNGSAVKVGGLH